MEKIPDDFSDFTERGQIVCSDKFLDRNDLLMKDVWRILDLWESGAGFTEIAECCNRQPCVIMVVVERFEPISNRWSQ